MIQRIRVKMLPWRESETVTQIRIRIQQYGQPDIGYETLKTEDDFVSFFEQMWAEIGRLIKQKAIQEQSNDS